MSPHLHGFAVSLPHLIQAIGAIAPLERSCGSKNA
jgi:hypothetical protein